MKTELTPLQRADCKTGQMMGNISPPLRPGRGSSRRRIQFADRDCFYHIMSRIAGGEMLLGDEEKEAFRKIMWRMSRFAGVEIITYAIMDNHFHLLIRVPERERFLRRFRGAKGEAKLMEHLSLLYSRPYLRQLRAELEMMRERGEEEAYQKTIESYYTRFCSLKHFGKELKERFSRWFNKTHGRRGTLWQDRFKSILVEDGNALRTMAAYIDLNPVRAGLVDDPKEYRWCGYGEAVAGSKRVRRGLCRVMGVPQNSWRYQGARAYRLLLLEDGTERMEERVEGGKRFEVRVRRGFDRERARKEWERGGKLKRSDLLRCRVRYFTDGLVLGDRSWVEKVFEAKRDWFGEKRKDGARELPEVSGKLFSLRALKQQAVE